MRFAGERSPTLAAPTAGLARRAIALAYEAILLSAVLLAAAAPFVVIAHAAGAAVARPGAEIWLLYGDGAAAFSLAEVDTFVRHGLPVIAVVGNDASWGQIARDQVPALGDDVGTALRAADYDLVARGYGAEGVVVRRPAEVADALRHAQAVAAAGRPVLVNVLLDRSDFRRGSITM